MACLGGLCGGRLVPEGRRIRRSRVEIRRKTFRLGRQLGREGLDDRIFIAALTEIQAEGKVGRLGRFRGLLNSPTNLKFTSSAFPGLFPLAAERQASRGRHEVGKKAGSGTVFFPLFFAPSFRHPHII